MVTVALSNGTEHRHATPSHAKQKCTSATCCSPSRLWRSVQLVIGENNQQGLLKLCQDPVRGPHVLDVVLTQRLANDASLYLASNKHRVLRLDPDGVALFGKSATDLNALQVALFHRHEDVACTLLELVRDHAVARDRQLFVTHTWGKRNDSLALACYLGMSKVVKLLLDMGLKPHGVPSQCAMECRSLVEQALPARKVPCQVLPPVQRSVLKEDIPVQVYDGHHPGLDPLRHDNPNKGDMVMYPMAQPMVLKFDREDGDADDDDDDDDNRDNDEDYGGDDSDEVPDLVVDQDKQRADFHDGAKFDLFESAVEIPGDDGGSTFPVRGPDDSECTSLPIMGPGDDGSAFPLIGTLMEPNQGALLSCIGDDSWSSNSSGGADLHEQSEFISSADDPVGSFGGGDSSVPREHFLCGQDNPVARLIPVGDWDSRKQQHVDNQPRQNRPDPPFTSTARQQRVDSQQRQNPDHWFSSAARQQKRRVDSQQRQNSPDHWLSSGSRQQQQHDDSQQRQNRPDHPLFSAARATRQQQFYTSSHLNGDTDNGSNGPSHDSFRTNRGIFSRMDLDSKFYRSCVYRS